jgi:hypothetical protein
MGKIGCVGPELSKSRIVCDAIPACPSFSAHPEFAAGLVETQIVDSEL